MLREYSIIQKEKINAQVEKINNIDNQKKENHIIRIELDRAKKEYDELNKYFKNNSKPNFWIRIFKPSKVKEYQRKVEKFEKIKQEYEQLAQLVSKLQTDEELDRVIEEARKTIDEIQNNFDLIRENPKIVFEYFRDTGTIIFTEDDKEFFVEQIKKSYDEKELFRDERNIEKVEDVILVHKTDFIPEDTINTRLSANVIDTTNITICGQKYTINLRPRRNSVHFAVNHEVTPNNGGNWNNKKYAVLVPLLEIPKEQFISNNCVDTFTNGEVKLSDKCYILCPIDEIEKVKKKNPSVCVIGYEGENVLDYANALLWMLGYSVERGNDWGFDDSKKQNQYTQLILDSGYGSLEHHFSSQAKEIERKNYYVSYIIGVLELIKNTPELYDVDSETIIEETEIGNYFYYCDIDTSQLFNYYLSQIGMEPNYLAEEINHESAFAYCKQLVNTAKILGKEQLSKKQ